jgi:hypothetical protein
MELKKGMRSIKKNGRKRKPTNRLLVTTRLDLRAFDALGAICCGFLWPLGGFWGLLLGFLTALGILGCIFPKCTNLDMLMSDRRMSEQQDVHASWHPC